MVMHTVADHCTNSSSGSSWQIFLQVLCALRENMPAILIHASHSLAERNRMDMQAVTVRALDTCVPMLLSPPNSLITC